MKKHIITFVILLTSLQYALAQQDDSLLTRLQAIYNSGTTFYNVDGIEITSQHLNSEFSVKNILKKFKKYSINESDLGTKDSLVAGQNYFISRSEEIAPGTAQYTSYYFIENENKGLSAITFQAVKKIDREFERKFVDLIMKNGLPASVFTPLQIDSINFAGRKIALGKSCNWMGINNVQCPYYGQMNWSVHKTLADAEQCMTGQYNVIKVKRGGKIISEEMVDVIFEGTAVKAKRAIYDFTGVRSLLVGMGGGKTLTIYFVASPATKNFVSCVMSFWNNDSINPGGLPPLLEQVMKLK
jgi:hypothetical protein